MRRTSSKVSNLIQVFGFSMNKPSFPLNIPCYMAANGSLIKPMNSKSLTITISRKLCKFLQYTQPSNNFPLTLPVKGSSNRMIFLEHYAMFQTSIMRKSLSGINCLKVPERCLKNLFLYQNLQNPTTPFTFLIRLQTS